MNKLWIVGFRDFGFEIAETAKEAGFQVAGFIDYEKGPPYCGTDLPVIWIKTEKLPDGLFVCGMTSTLTRHSVVQSVFELGRGRLQPTTVIHPRSIKTGSCQLGKGSIVNAGAVLASSTRLGQFNLINRGATIGHNTQLADYCTVGPGAHIGGNCKLGPHSYVGIGATILNRLEIGAHTLIGAGSVVVKDVPERTQVMGVPARVVRRDIDGM